MMYWFPEGRIQEQNPKSQFSEFKMWSVRNSTQKRAFRVWPITTYVLEKRLVNMAKLLPLHFFSTWAFAWGNHLVTKAINCILVNTKVNTGVHSTLDVYLASSLTSNFLG